MKKFVVLILTLGIFPMVSLAAPAQDTYLEWSANKCLETSPQVCWGRPSSGATITADGNFPWGIMATLNASTTVYLEFATSSENLLSPATRVYAETRYDDNVPWWESNTSHIGIFNVGVPCFDDYLDGQPLECHMGTAINFGNDFNLASLYGNGTQVWARIVGEPDGGALFYSDTITFTINNRNTGLYMPFLRQTAMYQLTRSLADSGFLKVIAIAAGIPLLFYLSKELIALLKQVK